MTAKASIWSSSASTMERCEVGVPGARSGAQVVSFFCGECKLHRYEG